MFYNTFKMNRAENCDACKAAASSSCAFFHIALILDIAVLAVSIFLCLRISILAGIALLVLVLVLDLIRLIIIDGHNQKPKVNPLT